MGIMAIGRIIVLSALVAQALSAPNGCLELCNFSQTGIHQTSGGYQDHANLVQGRTNLNDYDYARPGNWTEHNQYSTDGGHGKVHEERGQYEEGSKKMRYYKKNFTASYGTGNVHGINAAELGELSGQHRYDSRHVPSNQHIDSQSAYGHQLGQTVTKETGYNRVHSQQTQSSSIGSKSERLEDFGEYGGFSQVNQHVPSINTIDTQHHVETVPGNWNRVDSYRTDGGRGRVFEEEGQYVTGPKKVRYYKKNFTSSYSSDVPQTSVNSATLDELHSELQRNLQKDLDSLRRNVHQVSSTGHTAGTTHIDSTVGLTQEAVHGFHDLQTAESDSYNQNLGYRGVPSTGSVQHYTDQQQRETLIDTRQQSPYIHPTVAADTYGTESHRTYQSHENHMSRVHPVPQSGHLSSGYVPRGSYQASHNVHSSGHHLDHETRRAESLGTHHSNVLQNQLHTEDSQRVYNPHSSHVTYPSGHGETRHYEEHQRSSSYTGGTVAPERTIADHGIGHTERAHYDRDAYNEHRRRYHTAQGYESRAHTSGSSYDSAYRPSSGQLVTGSLDLGHAAHGADCTEETHQQYQESRYHRKYKRDAHHGDVQQHQAIDNEDFTQQNQDFGQESQQLEDLTQQTQGSNDFTQQSGKLEFGQQAVDNQHFDDLTQQSEQLTQQTEGQLEFGQQTVNNPHLEDLTQQTEGQLEFDQQTVDNPHLEDLTQQSEQFSDDLTQQTSGKLEFGQQTLDNQHLDNLTQQSEQFTQQTEGQLEFGQQIIHNPHLEDLTQQTQESDDLMKQTSGKLEFGQQTIENQHLEDLMHQIEQIVQQVRGSDDITQQTSGKLEFGQQTADTQQLEPFAQRTTRSDGLTPQPQLDKHKFGQQMLDNGPLEDLTQQSEQFSQQTEGKLEFGQQMVENQHLEDSSQQSERFAQQTVGPNDFTQQSVDKLEFGQQMQSIDKPANPKNQHLEEFNQQSKDFTQQTGGFDDFTQQTMGHLEFGQQMQQPQSYSKPKVGNHHLEDFTQQNEDLTQQVGGFDDFSQQTAGHLEYGQQREQQQKPSWPGHNTQRSEHYSQQNEWDIDNLSQQSRQYPSYNKNNEQSDWKLEQMSQGTDFDQDFTQQTDQDRQIMTGIKPAPKPKLRPRYQKHDSTPPHTDETDTNLDNVFKPVEVNPEADIDNFHGRLIQSGNRVTYPGSNHHTSSYPTQGSSVFDNQKENMDRLHWVHKSNDATVGLQWHYTYHPSDLTNVEGSHDNYYPRHNIDSMSQQTEDVQQQSKPFDFNQQEAQDKDALEDKYQNSHIPQSSQHDKYDQQSGSFQQIETSRFDNQFNQESEQTPSKVIPLQRNEHFQLTSEQKRSAQTTGETEDKMEGRILQAYGGGPYDASRSDDFYNRVKPNPSATLPPMDGDDPWDIRVKPMGTMMPRTWSTVSNTPEVVTTTTEVAETTMQAVETTTQPSFWNRVGHKITSTYDKAKEKAKEIFG